MAQGSKAPATAAAAPAGASLNGTQQPPAPAGVNRKKQKRREKQAAKQAAEAQRQDPAPAKLQPPPAQPHPHYAHDDLDGSAHYDDEGDFYSDDDDDDRYDQPYPTNAHHSEAYAGAPLSTGNGAGKKSRRKKKKRGASAAQQPVYDAPPISRNELPPPASHSDAPKDRIWSTETIEERERIREFWLSLPEDQRKSLVKIEKEAVLRKMKEQQKHSCSCTVCGRKRTAIEEELEQLYNAYYEELEVYAHRRPANGPPLPPVHYPSPRRGTPHHSRLMASHSQDEQYDESGDLSEGDEEYGDQDYSNSEISSEEDYSSEERNSLPPPEADFLNFGNSLQVKGGILTVADDLLKNDGKKFIEMMEQLAERRMQREEEAQYQSQPHMYARSQAPHHGPQPDEDDYDDDEDDDEDGYEDGDYEEDDEDEDETMTEEQRMEEGRRMFQIFAARMFEQRVLQAYREKVAAERQQKLLQELADEDDEQRELEAKKAKEAQKRKERKERQRLAKAEAQARKEARQAAKEAEAKAAEEKRQEEQRKKKEEERKKKEAERKALEEEKQRKNAEKLKRQQEERERQQEAERIQRELKAQEKKAKEEARRKEREEREAKEREAREKKAQEDKERREREAKAKAEKDRIRREEQAAAPSAKKNSQPVPVPLPPGLLKQTSSTGVSSPHVAHVTPALPKAPTPNRPRQSSQQGSHGSSPKTPHVAPGTSKSMSPSSQMQNIMGPKSILTKPGTAQQPTPAHHGPLPPPAPQAGPPPGMLGPTGVDANMPPGLNGGFPHGQPMMPPGMGGPRHSIPMFPPQPGSQNFRGFPPPGVHAPNSMPMGRGYPQDVPPGFGGVPAFGGPNQMPGFGMGIPSHSRQASGSFDKANVDSPNVAPLGQPIQRPAPIQRPSSVKPREDSRLARGSDIDELADHLGSKALLDDADDEPPAEPRRTSVQTHGSLRGGPLGFGFPDPSGHPRSDSYAPFGGSNSATSVWSTPPMPFPTAGAAGWGNSPTSGMFNNPFPTLGAPRPNEQRIVWIRRLLCSACKSLAPRSGPDGHLDISDVVHQIDSVRNAAEPSITLQEIKEACDIFGDSSNGGGTLEYNEMAPNSGHITHIRYIEGGGPSAALGEIGSPVPAHSLPVGGGVFTGRPFPGLGSQGY